MAPSTIQRVAVREVGRPEQLADRAVGAGPAQDAVVRDVAPHERVLVGQVDRALGPDRAIGEADELRIGRHEPFEARVADDPLDGLALHAPDAIGSGTSPLAGRASVPDGYAVSSTGLTGHGPALAATLDAQLEVPPDDVADEATLEVAHTLDRLPIELGDDVADAQPGARRGTGLEQLHDLEAAWPADPRGDRLAERPGAADDAEERPTDATVDDQGVEDPAR